MTPESSKALRAPFKPEQIGKLPKAGLLLDYVGHASVTDRLLEVDPGWSWEPFALDEHGLPLVVSGELWIRLTVAGVTRPGVGDGKNSKERIGDALRNAAMRFGVALDLWAKDGLAGTDDVPPEPTVSHVPASKERVAELMQTVSLASLGPWVKDQAFPWPWPDSACDAIEAKAAETLEAVF